MNFSGRTRCMQLSVDAARWPDKMLKGFLSLDGKALSGKQVRDELLKMREAGLEVVPCNKHQCNDKGICTGENLVDDGIEHGQL